MLLFTVAALATCAQSFGATLYGATASGSPGRLYVLNSANGSQVQDVGPLSDVTGLNYPITGLAFHPTTGVLYGSTGNNPAATAGRFVTINPATAQVTFIGPFNAGPTNDEGTPATMTDLAFDSAGNLFGVTSIGGPQLYSINIATGQATVIGNSGLASTSGGGLAISSGGVFYGTPTASRFGTYDTTTGVYTNIAAPNRPGNAGALAALDFDPTSGVLYAMHHVTGLAAADKSCHHQPCGRNGYFVGLFGDCPRRNCVPAGHHPRAELDRATAGQGADMVRHEDARALLGVSSCPNAACNPGELRAMRG